MKVLTARKTRLKRALISEAMKGNLNCEKWTFDKSYALLNRALQVSGSGEVDFIGEVAREVGTTRYILEHVSNKAPELKRLWEAIKANCESNCYTNGKKGKINTAMAIINLKSNHKWTDRIDTTSNDEVIKPQVNILNIKENELSRTLQQRLTKE